MINKTPDMTLTLPSGCPTNDLLHWPSSDRRPPTSDLRPPTSHLRPPTSDFRPLTSDLRPPTFDLRPSTFDFSALPPRTSPFQLACWCDVWMGMRVAHSAGRLTILPSSFAFLLLLPPPPLSLLSPSRSRRTALPFACSCIDRASRPLLALSLPQPFACFLVLLAVFAVFFRYF